MSETNAIPTEAAKPFGAPPTEDEFTLDFAPRQGKIELADNLYDMTLSSMSVEDNPFEPGKKRRVWKFRPEGCESDLYFYTSLTTGPKIGEVMKALRVDFDEAGKTTVKLSDLVGRKCKGLVKNEKSTKGDGVFPRLKNLLAA